MIGDKWYFHASAISDEVVDAIHKAAFDVAHTQIDGATFNNDSEWRKSKIIFMSHREDIRNAMYKFVVEANRETFDIAVENYGDIQYSTYHEDDGGHYNWHHDVDYNVRTAYHRKFSLVCQLTDPSEYEGGDLLFEGMDEPVENFRQKGSVFVFPSYLPHKVTPVTKGMRNSLVIWFEGPRWR